jgi:4-hydroxybenzoate polyprenyltransferase
MSVAIPSQTPARQYARVVRYFASTRGVEVCVLQASPLLGAYLAGFHLDPDNLARLLVLLLGSIALTAHVFVFNDWADYNDAPDPRRASSGPSAYGIRRDQVAHVAIALLVLANVAFVALGPPAILFGDAIALLSLLYSFSPRLGKGTPIAASLNHVLGGSLHFLLGYTAFGAVDATGVAISLCFGLVFAAGHLTQEVRDHESDLGNQIRTSAVAFGCRRAFVASFCLFSAAYLLIVGLAAVGSLPRILVLAVIAWGLQARWSAEALRRGLGFESAVWIQRRYRLLFALIGLAMLVR